MRFVSSHKFEALRGRLNGRNSAGKPGWNTYESRHLGGQLSWSGKQEARRLSNEWCLAVASSGVVERVCVCAGEEVRDAVVYLEICTLLYISL